MTGPTGGEDRLPVLVAAAHAIERDDPVWAIDLAATASEAALSQTPLLRSRTTRVSMVNILSGGGPSPAGRLARMLGLERARTEVSTVGGNSPQWLVNRAAESIARGEDEVVLIAGAESQHSKMRTRSKAPGTASAGAAQRTSRIDDAASEADPMVGDDRPGAGPAELAAGLIAPVHLYALFESVIAHRAGRSFEQHRRFLGELMAPFSEVAAKHPFAWFPQARSPHEISTIAPDNRLVSEPYTKRMCAVMGVDQAAAVVVTSLKAAREAGVADRAVFCCAGADTADVWFPTARPDLGSSPGIAAAASAALEAAGIGVDDVDAIDLYSCFPCVVEMAVEALGISAHDERGLTVTGGLAYFGGPGNDYTLHAIATMTDKLRDEGGTGLVSGLGWYATKHSFGVYASAPPDDGWRRGDTSRAQSDIDASGIEVADPTRLSAEGPTTATVVAGTVVMGRDGDASAAPVVARLDDGRQVALAAEESDLPFLAGQSLVGRRVRLEGPGARYRLGE